MSYPHSIQPLVIEDEHNAKQHYEAVFQRLSQHYPLVAPHCAFCYEDARRMLALDRIYHLVVLDLRLPEKPGQPPAETLDFGLALLRECAHRNAYPIPALLVISGHLQHASQRELEEQVRGGFFSGRVLVKSDHLENEIEGAIKQALHYCEVGIHVRDGGNKVFPTLAPREEDLLRRGVLQQGQSIGLDLSWWSSGYDPYAGWTKILIGRFLLNQGRGVSLYTFFKLATDQGAGTVLREADLLAHKLKHVKVLGTLIAGDRSLLITQAAGSGEAPPLSLDDILGRPPAEVALHLPGIVVAIAQQVASLGDRTPDQRPVRELLWPDHRLERIRTQWERRGGPGLLAEAAPGGADPVALYAQLQASATLVRYERQSCLHGDLNYTNIALDAAPSGGLIASIFDASGCQAGPSVRDLAMLEVTALLHQDAGEDEYLLQRCAALYGNEVAIQASADAGTGSHRVNNTLCLLAEVRAQALRLASPQLYALLVFDNALLQLGGLDFGSAFNKVRYPRDAALLAALAAGWLQRVAPDYVSQRPATELH